MRKGFLEKPIHECLVKIGQVGVPYLKSLQLIKADADLWDEILISRWKNDRSALHPVAQAQLDVRNTLTQMETLPVF